MIGAGRGRFSFVHVADAAAVTLAALERGQGGIYNIVDDTPVAVSEWLPRYAQLIGAPRPARVPRLLGRLVGGSYADYLMNRQRGASNAKARRELGWAPRYPTLQGFAAELGE